MKVSLQKQDSGRKKLSDTYNLKALFPQVAGEWDYDKNKEKPEDMYPYSGKKVYWTCAFNPEHKWKAVISNRTKRLQGCPICGKQRKSSFPEQAIYYYMKKVFPDCENRFRIGGWEIDIWIPTLKTGIEYNGIFHTLYQREELDARKKADITGLGIKLLTVWEEAGSLKETAVIQGTEILCRPDNEYRYMDRVIGLLFTMLRNSGKDGAEKEVDINVKRDHHYIRTLLVEGRKKNSIAAKYPELAKEWHKEANWPITPEMVEYGSGDLYTWQCAKGHVWKATPNKRTGRRDGCPFCSCHRVSNANRLSVVNPGVARMWLEDKKSGKTPADVSCHSGLVVLWKCERGHIWERSVKEMVRSGKCPYCSGQRILRETSLAAKYPKLAEQWDWDKNNSSPWETAPAGQAYVWWKCEKGHSWQARISNRSILKRGCPYCAGRYPLPGQNMADLYPQLAEEWNYEKNGRLGPSDFRPKSNKKVWWKCKRGHEWLAEIRSRAEGGKCPICRSRYVREGKSLAEVCTEAAKRWDYEKNEGLDPHTVSYGSDKKVWWRCIRYPDHQWRRRIDHEVSGKGCPYCAGIRVCRENSLASLFPELVREWDYEENKTLQPHDVLYNTRRSVGWICREGHRWKASVYSRTQKKRGCPVCKRRASL